MGAESITNGLYGREARQFAPSLSGVFYACQSSGFFERLNTEAQKQTSDISSPRDNAAEKFSKALSVILKQDPAAINFLHNADIARLANITQGDNFKNLEQIQKIYSLYKPDRDPTFSAWDAERKIEMLDRIDRNETIQDILKRNGKSPLGATDRMNMATELTRIQSEVYGYRMPKLFFMYSDTDGSSAFERNGNIYFNERKVANDPVSRFIKSTIHENDHVFQKTILSRFGQISLHETNWMAERGLTEGAMSPEDYEALKSDTREWVDHHLPGGLDDRINRELLRDGMLRNTAMAFYLGQAQYFLPDDKVKGYFDNAREKHSFRAEKAGDYIMGDTSAKAAMRDELESKIETWNTSKAALQNENRGFDNKTCADISNAFAPQPAAPLLP